MMAMESNASPPPAEVQVNLPLIVLVGKAKGSGGGIVIETSWAHLNLPGVIGILRSTVDSLTDRLVSSLLATASYAPIVVAGQDMVSGFVPECEGVKCVAPNDAAAAELLRDALRVYIVKRLDDQGGLSLPHSHAVAAAPAV